MKRETSKPLPGARKEAEMIGQRLGVTEAFVRRGRNKASGLERTKSVCLVHIAEHGNAERGEIALLCPLQPPPPGFHKKKITF